MKKAWSEKEMLSLIAKTITVGNPLLETGIGDDCAVLRLPQRKRPLLLTTDILNEEIHFRREWISPFLLGYKSLAVNQSDIAAMGGHPLIFTVSLSLPKDVPENFLRDFYRGMDEAARRSGGALAGGDLSRSPHGICLSIAMIGEAWGARPILRSGARPGDLICVTGRLGLSAIGLHLLEQGCRLSPRAMGAKDVPARTRSQWIRSCLQAHLAPQPKMQVAEMLGRKGLPTAMMDISDGLSIDLARLCEASGVGAEIEFERIPGCPQPLLSEEEQEHCLLHGGEDYELLFTLPAAKASTVLKGLSETTGVEVTVIGTITSRTGGPSILRKGKRGPLPAKGFDHFTEV